MGCFYLYSSDSSNSTRSSVDSDVRDALYAHLYFKDQSQVQEDSFAGSSDSSSAVPSGTNLNVLSRHCIIILSCDIHDISVFGFFLCASIHVHVSVIRVFTIP